MAIQLNAKTDTRNVFCWGAFDILHEGHFRLFQKASELGDLYVIVLPDKRMAENKRLVHNEIERKKNLLKTGLVKDVFIDALPNIQCFNMIAPDMFCFGYDQDIRWQDRLKKYILSKFPRCEFLTMDKYANIHSSDLKRGFGL